MWDFDDILIYFYKYEVIALSDQKYNLFAEWIILQNKYQRIYSELIFYMQEKMAINGEKCGV